MSNEAMMSMRSYTYSSDALAASRTLAPSGTGKCPRLTDQKEAIVIDILGSVRSIAHSVDIPLVMQIE